MIQYTSLLQIPSNILSLHMQFKALSTQYFYLPLLSFLLFVFIYLISICYKLYIFITLTCYKLYIFLFYFQVFLIHTILMRLLLLHTFSTDFYVKPVSCNCQNHVVQFKFSFLKLATSDCFHKVFLHYKLISAWIVNIPASVQTFLRSALLKLSESLTITSK